MNTANPGSPIVTAKAPSRAANALRVIPTDMLYGGAMVIVITAIAACFALAF